MKRFHFLLISLILASSPVFSQTGAPDRVSSGTAAASAQPAKEDNLQTDPAKESSAFEETVSGQQQETGTGIDTDVETDAEALASGTTEQLELDKNGPWMVCAEQASGYINLKERTILKNAKAKTGEFYQRFFIGEDIQALIGLGSIERVSVDVSRLPGEMKSSDKSGPYPCHKITYIITEKPTLEDIELLGRDELSKSKILDAMTLKKKDFFSPGKVNLDIEAVKAKYAEEGYISTKITPEVVNGSKPNSVILKLHISEGEESKVADVIIYGLGDGFPRKKILKQTENRPGKTFSEKDLPKDQAEISQFYRNNGYSDFQITSASVAYSDDKSQVVIIYHFNEGPRSKFGETSFFGNTIFSDPELRKALVYKRGKTYKQEYFADSLRAIQEMYADKGYLRAQVQPETKYNPATGELDIELYFVENSVVYVGNVDVEGNEATKKYVFTREINVKPGDVYSSSKVRRSHDKIMNLGFIDDVQVDMAPSPEPDKVDLNFNVVEGKPGMFTAGGAVSSVDGVYGEISAQHMNLFGRAQRLALSWKFGSRVLDYTLSWTTPWVDKKPVSLGFDLFNTKRLKPYSTSSTAYREHSSGGRVRVGPRFDDDKLSLNFAYTYESITVDNIESAFNTLLFPGTSVTSSLSTELVYDTRDYIWDPTSGMKNSLSFELAGGPLMGDIDICKIGLSSSYNYKLFEIDDYPFVWSLANRFGVVTHYGKTDSVPVYNRYFLGGQDTVRGYDNNGQIGPSDGGNLYYVLNSEIRFPLARERRKTLIAGAFFFDLGNDWKNFSNIKLITGAGENEFKMGAGFGIRFTTPSFPIRLDWGYGFNHKPGDSKSEFYFTIGNVF
ncbi:MAG: outer membrane protein assembly factor BamA [Elusimicrobiaceae bacterium]